MPYRLCVLLLLCLWSPAVGVAQDSARVLFEEGVAFADEGQWSLAVTRFRAALAAHPSSVIEFNLGLALTHTNQSIEAIEVLERVAHRDGVDAALRTEAMAAVTTQRLQVAEVDVTYACSTEGLTLHVDGAPRPLALSIACSRLPPPQACPQRSVSCIAVARLGPFTSSSAAACEGLRSSRARPR